MSITEIRIAGFGGQGVILAATVIGKAVSIFQDGFSTMTQSFGPEARGSACSAQVIISDLPIFYPYVTQPDVLVAMSQEAFTRFSPDLKSGGVLLVEQELVRVSGLERGERVYSIPATRIAEQLGKRMAANIVMVGFFSAVTALVDPDAMRRAVADSVPSKFRELNLKAFDRGFLYGITPEAVFEDSMDSDNSVLQLEGTA